MPRTTLHARLSVLAILVTTLLMASAARADEPANPLDHNGQAGGQGQAVQTPPDWVVPGARLTYYVGDSTHVKNPRPNDTRAGGGGGFRQFDIVAVTDAGVLIEIRNYRVVQPGSVPELMSTVKHIVDHATGNGLWVHPDQIAATQPTRDPNANPQIEVRDVGIDGETYDAIHITAKSEDGNTTFLRVYDRQTGIELYRSDRQENRETITVAHSEYRGYRVAELPWQGTEFTEQVQRVQKLVFAAADILETPQSPGIEQMPDTRTEFEAEFTFENQSPSQIGIRLNMRVSGVPAANQPPEHRDWISPSERMGIYIDPAVLAQLEKGQVLDEDPILGYQIVVTDVFEVQGVTLVEITEQRRGNSYLSQSTYDASVGLQVASTSTQPSMYERFETQLVRVE